MNKLIYQDLSSFIMPANFRGKPGWFVQLWWLVQALLFKPSPQFLYGWRRFLLRSFGAQVGRGVIIRASAHFQFPWKVTLGDHCWIGDEVVIYSLGPISIGDNAVVSQRSYLCAGSHDMLDATFTITSHEVVVEAECWLATDVFVGPSVRIGRGAVVGARSSVFKSIPGGKVYAGSPVKMIKDRK
jgi:putative colanic acid biosynthesis acetyltransferase WcaF